jgi:hypothetical protein
MMLRVYEDGPDGPFQCDIERSRIVRWAKILKPLTDYPRAKTYIKLDTGETIFVTDSIDELRAMK